MTEEINWHDHALEQYRRDAEQAIDWARGNVPDRVLIARVLELLRTYVEVPGVGERPQFADEQMLSLALHTIGRIRRMGYWREMNDLWPQLCKIAELAGDVDRYLIFVKYMATAKGNVGEKAEELAIYAQLLAHPRFPAATPTLQANLLITHAVTLLWNGRRQEAAPLLQRCLAITNPDAQASNRGEHHQDADVYLGLGNTPLWETRAYALNQQGVLHMFCGEFSTARRRFAEMHAIFQAHGEAGNLLCVAQQAIGRLLLYERKYADALDLLTQGYAVRQRWNDREGIAVNAIYMAAARIGLQQFDVAKTLLTSALGICHDLENRHDLALCHLYFAHLALRQQNLESALVHWQELATLAPDIVLHFVEVRGLIRKVPVLFRCGEWALAWQLLKLLWQSVRNDQLTVRMGWRFVFV